MKTGYRILITGLVLLVGTIIGSVGTLLIGNGDLLKFSRDKVNISPPKLDFLSHAFGPPIKLDKEFQIHDDGQSYYTGQWLWRDDFCSKLMRAEFNPDGRCRNLSIWFFQARYMENWEPDSTFSASPELVDEIKESAVLPSDSDLRKILGKINEEWQTHPDATSFDFSGSSTGIACVMTNGENRKGSYEGTSICFSSDLYGQGVEPGEKGLRLNIYFWQAYGYD